MLVPFDESEQNKQRVRDRDALSLLWLLHVSVVPIVPLSALINVCKTVIIHSSKTFAAAKLHKKNDIHKKNTKKRAQRALFFLVCDVCFSLPLEFFVSENAVHYFAGRLG